jgi:hypothetical protein
LTIAKRDGTVLYNSFPKEDRRPQAADAIKTAFREHGGRKLTAGEGRTRPPAKAAESGTPQYKDKLRTAARSKPPKTPGKSK